MKKIVRYLLISSLLFFVVAAASAQTQSKYKKGRTEKHGRKADTGKGGKRKNKIGKEEVARHNAATAKDKQKAHEKKLKANKGYVKAEKQRRKEKAAEEN